LYQFARECGAGLCGSLSATNAASFIRLLLERIVVLTQASGAASKALATTNKKHGAPQGRAHSKDKDPKASENSTIGGRSRIKHPQPALDIAALVSRLERVADPMCLSVRHTPPSSAESSKSGAEATTGIPSSSVDGSVSGCAIASVLAGSPADNSTTSTVCGCDSYGCNCSTEEATAGLVQHQSENSNKSCTTSQQLLNQADGENRCPASDEACANSAKLANGADTANSADDVSALLEVVQSTCASLARRIKDHLPKNQKETAEAQFGETDHSAVLAAATATRNLLSEVETAFLATRPFAVKNNIDQDGACGTQWYSVCTPLATSEADEQSLNASLVSDYFNFELEPSQNSRHTGSRTKTIANNGSDSCTAPCNTSANRLAEAAPSPFEALEQWSTLGGWMLELQRAPSLQSPTVSSVMPCDGSEVSVTLSELQRSPPAQSPRVSSVMPSDAL